MTQDPDSKKLVKIIQDLSQLRTLDEIMTLVRTAARDIAQADGATFVLKDRGFCYYADEDAISPLWKGQRFPLEMCISGWAMLHKEQVLIEDIYLDSRIPIDAYRPTFVKSLMMTPIRRNDPIGAIGTYWSRKHLPSVEQREFLQALADSVSVAMENVELYGSLEKRVSELSQANRAKDEFLMIVSHELRTPLNSILGWSELLKEGTSDADEIKTALEAIERNAREENRVLENLFDTSQILMGRLRIEPEAVDLAMLLRDAVQAQQNVARAKEIRLDLSTSLELARVHGDPARLRQVFDQLVGNAIKFSRSGQGVRVILDRSGPGCRIRVVDEGAGIDPEVLPELFGRFKQADGSLTRKFSGLGLGLAIARALVEAHDGQISAESAGVGKGSIVTVTIPLEGQEGPGGETIS